MRCRGCAFDAWTAYWVGQPRDLFRDRQPPGIGAKSGVTGISRIHEMPAKRLRNAVMRIRPRPPFPHSRRPAVVLALAGMVYQGLRIEPSVRAWPRVPSTHGGADAVAVEGPQGPSIQTPPQPNPGHGRSRCLSIEPPVRRRPSVRPSLSFLLLLSLGLSKERSGRIAGAPTLRSCLFARR